jgi:uncharacterized repeat protein (TIGR02543 family)
MNKKRLLSAGLPVVLAAISVLIAACVLENDVAKHDAWPLPDGHGSGTAANQFGAVTVELTLTGGIITDAKVSGNQTGPGPDAIKAAPGLIVLSNSVDFDKISGATYTAKAISEAGRQALDLIGGAEPPKIWTVTFITGVGFPLTKEVTNGSSVAEPDAPSLVGYDFDGWFTAREGGTKVIVWTDPITADTTYYAQWSVLKEIPSFSGTQDGSADGEAGGIKVTAHVTVTFTAGVITNMIFTSNDPFDDPEDADFSYTTEQIKSALIEAAKAANSAGNFDKPDACSGATATYRATQAAVKDAISKISAE